MLFFSLSRPLSIWSRVDLSCDLTCERWATFSSAATRSSLDFARVAERCFFSLFNLLMTSSCSPTSDCKTLIVWSRLPLSCSTFNIASSTSSISFLTAPIDPVCELMKREGDGEALAESVMQKLDANQDGKITQEEAMNACMTDDEILRLLNLSVNKHFHY